MRLKHFKLFLVMACLSLLAGMTHAATFGPPANASSLPAQVVYLSKAGVTNDASLAIGASTAGDVDNKAAIQAVLNKAANGPLTVYWNVHCAATGPLLVYSNTHIIFYRGCGVIQLYGGANTFPKVSLFENAHQTVGQGAQFNAGGAGTGFGSGNMTHRLLGNFGDHDITLEGPGVINQNNPQSNTAEYTGSSNGTGWENGFPVAVEFYGVQYLTVKDVTIEQTTAYATQFCNIQYATFRDIRVDETGQQIPGHDGIHINGPAQYVNIDGGHYICKDDCIALNADDGQLAAPGTNTGNFFFPLPGDITDVNINNPNFNAGGILGIRLLSSTSRIDRINIYHPTGVTQGEWLLCNNFLSNPGGAQQTLLGGNGNVGSVSVTDPEVSIAGQTVSGGAEYFYGQVMLEDAIESFRVKGMHRHNQPTFTTQGPTTNSDPLIYVGGRAGAVNTLEVDDCGDYTNAAKSFTSPMVEVHGTVYNAIFRNDSITRDQGMTATNDPLLRVVSGGTVGTASIFGGAFDRISNVVDLQSGASLTNCLLSGVSHTAANGGATVNVAAGVTLKNLGVSGYAGLLAKSTTGTFTNSWGDGLTASYTEASATVYNNTTFAGTAGTSLSGYASQTGGTWASTGSGTVPTLTGTGGVSTSSTSGSQVNSVDGTVVNGVVRMTWTPKSVGERCQLALRVTDINNYVAVNMEESGGIGVYDASGGAAGSNLASTNSQTFALGVAHSVVATLSGASLTLVVDGGAPVTATITHNLTSTRNGFSFYSNPGAVVSAFSIKSS